MIHKNTKFVIGFIAICVPYISSIYLFHHSMILRTRPWKVHNYTYLKIISANASFVFNCNNGNSVQMSLPFASHFNHAYYSIRSIPLAYVYIYICSRAKKLLNFISQLFSCYFIVLFVTLISNDTILSYPCTQRS